MKPLFTLLFTTLLFLQLDSASAHASKQKNTSLYTLEERNVKNFNGIAVAGPIVVIVKLGNQENLRFEGDEEAISTLVSEVKGSILMIRPKTSWTSWAKKYENKKIVAYVTAKQISNLTVSGDGSISVTGTITASEFATTLSGSGTIKANVEADKITGVVSGAGSINISGKADKASVTMSGPGSFGSKALSVNELSARISGKGQINVNTDGKIKALISGSGHVYYSGNPEIEKTILGAGDVVEK